MTHKIEIIFISFSFLEFTLTPYSIIKWSEGPQVDNELPLLVEEQLQSFGFVMLAILQSKNQLVIQT